MPQGRDITSHVTRRTWIPTTPILIGLVTWRCRVRALITASLLVHASSLSAPCFATDKSDQTALSQRMADVYSQGVQAYRQRNWSGAASAFQEYISTPPPGPSWLDAMFYLAEVQVQLKDYRTARGHYGNYISACDHRMSPMLPHARFRIGEMSYLLGDTTRAIRELSAFIDEYPQESAAERAQSYLRELATAEKGTIAADPVESSPTTGSDQAVHQNQDDVITLEAIRNAEETRDHQQAWQMANIYLHQQNGTSRADQLEAAHVAARSSCLCLGPQGADNHFCNVLRSGQRTLDEELALRRSLVMAHRAAGCERYAAREEDRLLCLEKALAGNQPQRLAPAAGTHAPLEATQAKISRNLDR